MVGRRAALKVMVQCVPQKDTCNPSQVIQRSLYLLPESISLAVLCCGICWDNRAPPVGMGGGNYSFMGAWQLCILDAVTYLRRRVDWTANLL